MNKAQLIEAVAKRLPPEQAALAVECTLDAIVRALVAGERVAVTGFGSFEVRSYDERRARNPQTGEAILVPPTKRARFNAGANLTELINGKKLPPLTESAITKAPKGSKTKKGN